MLYADHNATSPLHSTVWEKMKPFLREEFGNPSSTFHRLGARARDAVEEARSHVAALLGAGPEEVVFLSGGTESCAQALIGAAKARSRCRLIYSTVEHSAVGETVRFLQEFRGCTLSEVPVAGDGSLDEERLRRECEASPEAVVSIMSANNETGICVPLERFAEAFSAAGCTVHTDAVQLAGKAPIDFSALPAELLSVSAHKFGGPKGIGALLVKAGARWEPVIKGGGQEAGRRGGTESVPLIVGMGEAARICAEQLASGARSHVAALRDEFEELLCSRLSDVQINGRGCPRLDNTSSLCIDGVSSKNLRAALAEQDAVIAAGSACSSSQLKPSHVLRAMGRSVFECVSTIRVSFGMSSTQAEVERLVELIAAESEAQRSFANAQVDRRLE